MKFFRDRGPARLRAPLQHQRLVSGLRQIKRGYQSVVAAADNHHIALVPFRRHIGGSLMSFKISKADRRPGAPMIPPPGCVADPHI